MAVAITVTMVSSINSSSDDSSTSSNGGGIVIIVVISITAMIVIVIPMFPLPITAASISYSLCSRYRHEHFIEMST